MIAWAAVTVLVAACSSDGDQPFPGAAAPTSASSSASDSALTTETAPEASAGQIVIDPAAAGSPFDRRLLGTNMPAWVGPVKLGDQAFQQRIADLGTTVVRMPGGSWSSAYDWLACEDGDADGCYWTWAARPSDYLGFLADTGLDGMWTVNFNSTAQSAAALVAFFNGAVTDQRVIGVDRDGKDWGTVGQWAALRGEHGHPEPHRVQYWEIGNEVYGANADAGPECASFGWEDLWTCDGATYVAGDDAHDGFVAYEAAMRAVDPDILIGAVGIGGSQSEWSGFGEKVIAAAAELFDFYIVHDYGFSETPSYDEALKRPVDAWPHVMKGPLDELANVRSGTPAPVAITEYNMFFFADGDKTAMMSSAIDAIYMADTIGQMARNGVQMANQWNIVNGTNSTEGDFGLLDPDTSEPMPQFYAIALWSRFGDHLAPCSAGFDAELTLDVFCGRDDAGVLSVMAINKTDAPVESSIAGLAASTYDVVVDVAAATSLDDTTMVYNGSSNRALPLDDSPGTSLGSTVGGSIDVTFDPFSITLVTLSPRSPAG